MALEFITVLMYASLLNDHPINMFYISNAASLHAQMISRVKLLAEFWILSTKKNAVFLSKCGVMNLILHIGG